MKKKQVVIVLGMHRSGTSAVTHGLETLGVNLGNRLMPPISDNNEKGFFEDIDVYTFDLELLKLLRDPQIEGVGRQVGSTEVAANIGWDSLSPLTAESFVGEQFSELQTRAVKMLNEKISDGRPFGIKDPRIGLLLPFWQKVFGKLKAQQSYVIVIRHPKSVAVSLANRDGFELEKGYYLWLEHVIPSVLETGGKDRVVVDFDLLMSNPEVQLERMAKASRLPFVAGSSEVDDYIGKFLDDKLRHTQFQLSDLQHDPAMPLEVIEAYEVLSRVALDELGIDSSEVKKTFVRLKTRLQEMSPALNYMTRQDKKISEQHRQLASLNHAVAERDNVRREYQQAVAERDGQIAQLNHSVEEAMQSIEAIRGSTSWRATAPLRLVISKVRGSMSVVKLLPGIVQFGGGVTASTGKAVRVLSKEGWTGVKRRILYVAGDRKEEASSVIRPDLTRGKVKPNDYDEWVRRYDTLTDADRDAIKARIDQLPCRPLISIVMPVYNPPLGVLKEAIQSVLNQLYPNWELCIADDASTRKGVRKQLQRWADSDTRVKVVYREINGHISAASNSALAIARGEYIALLDNDDLLSEHALYYVAQAIVEHPDAGLIYSDEDKIDQSGRRFAPYFKSDWNPDLFLSQNMICHLGIFRADLLKKLGGFREGYEGAQDYDLAMRCTEQLEPYQIVHIPRVLYHWRSHPGSTAQTGSEKGYALLAGERTLNDHFTRMGVSARAELLDFGMYRVRYELLQPAPLVSLIIPTRNGLELIRQCIKSIIDKTTYKNLEILIVDNKSDDPHTLEYFAGLSGDDRIRVLRDERPFNFSALNNSAVTHAKGEFVALINNDIEVITPEWLEEMMGLATQPGVGAVGARLWYPDDTLQHGGVILGIGGVAGHVHKHFHKDHPGYFGRDRLIQTLSAVTAACLLIRKSIYQEIGGLDETNLKVAFNDVDFCLRVREAGYRNVWTPYAELYHHESATRGYEDTPEKRSRFQSEVLYMKKRWGDNLSNDPAYNPNLTLDREDYSFAWPPRVVPFSGFNRGKVMNNE